MVGTAGSSPGFVDEFTPEVQDILRRIKALCRTRNTKLRDFCTDYDPLQKGTIINNKFETVMSAGNIPLTTAETDLLLRAFAASKPPGHFDYRKFCWLIDGGNERYERAPTSNSEQFDARAVLTASLQPAATKDLSSSSELHGILERARQAVHARGIALKEAFMPFDRLRKGTVSKVCTL